MKAWVLTAHGAPERVLQLQDRPVPRPAEGEVLIESEAFGLNYADVMAVKGLYREAPPLPSVLGYETVGRVQEMGAGVPSALVGQRVVAIARFGGFAQHAVTDHRTIAAIPEDMPVGTALAMATQGCTAWYMARIARPLRAGERVLVHSAAGGVGHLLVQLAVQAGCEVIAVAGGAGKAAHLRTLGAHHVVDRHAGPYADKVAQVVGPYGLDVSFNAVGGASFKRDLRLLGAGGAVVLFGGAERGARKGAFGTLRFVWDMGLLVPVFLMMSGRSLIGVNMLRIGGRAPGILTECLQHTVRAAVEGRLVPTVHRTWPAAELPAALAALEAGGTMGKVALRW